jgi:hypothetical protein
LELISPRILKLANWIALALLVVLGYLWQGPKFGLGVLMGGLLVVFNFHWLHRNLKNLLEGPSRSESRLGQAKAFFAARQALRFLVTLVVLYLLLRQDWVNVIGLVVGLSTTVLTLMAIAIIEVIKLNKKKEANPSHGTPHSVS